MFLKNKFTNVQFEVFIRLKCFVKDYFNYFLLMNFYYINTVVVILTANILIDVYLSITMTADEYIWPVLSTHLIFKICLFIKTFIWYFINTKNDRS